jgi:hypothetical protein
MRSNTILTTGIVVLVSMVMLMAYVQFFKRSMVRWKKVTFSLTVCPVVSVP